MSYVVPPSVFGAACPQSVLFVFISRLPPTAVCLLCLLCTCKSCRPQQLVVFVNPYGGRRQARRTWLKLAEPILTAAGVHCQLVETQYQVRKGSRGCTMVLSVDTLGGRVDSHALHTAA